MARPSHPNQVKDKFIQVATVYIDEVVTDPALMKAYTALVEAAVKKGGKAEKDYSAVKISVAKNAKQLMEELGQEQREWDRMDAQYLKALDGDPDHEIRDYNRRLLSDWAEAEGRPDPFDCFAATDPELAKMRRELGLDSEQAGTVSGDVV